MRAAGGRLMLLEILIVAEVILAGVLGFFPMGRRGLAIWLVLLGALFLLGVWTLQDVFGLFFVLLALLFLWHCLVTLFWRLGRSTDQENGKADRAQPVTTGRRGLVLWLVLFGSLMLLAVIWLVLLGIRFWSDAWTGRDVLALFVALAALLFLWQHLATLFSRLGRSTEQANGAPDRGHPTEMGRRGLVFWLVLLGSLVLLSFWTRESAFAVLFFLAGSLFVFHSCHTLSRWWDRRSGQTNGAADRD